jgi:Protein of unknown function (DUF3592)
LNSILYLPGLFGVIGLFLILSSLRVLNKSFKSGKWKKIKGIIRKSKEIKMLEFSEHIVPRKEPSIRYEYLVNGEKYTNNKIFNIDNNTYIYNKTKTILNKYRENKYVEVFYNEDNPKDSFLELASIIPIYLTILVGFILVLFGVLVVLSY